MSKGIQQRNIEAIERQAKKTYKDFVVKQLFSDGLHRSWRCENPKYSNRWFEIHTVPGHLFVTGDNGFLAVERNPDMLPWCRGSINSIYYFEEKCQSEICLKKYDRKLAREYLEEEIADEETGEETRQNFKDHLAVYEECENEQDFYGLISDHCGGSDYPEVEIFTDSFLWCREAIRWFLKAIEKGETDE